MSNSFAVGPGNPALRMLAGHDQTLLRVAERLATGQRINRGSDDPAGLISSENLRAELASLEAETRSVERSEAVASTADSALGEISSMLTEAEALNVANANTGGMSDAERRANQMEIDSVVQSVDRIAGTSSFNGQRLLDGSMSVSAGGQSETIESAAATDLGEVEVDGRTYSLSDVSGSLDSETMQQVLRAAREQVSEQRGVLGSFSRNAIGTERQRVGAAVENVSRAESQIRDTDYAEESAELARVGALREATIGVLALANAGSDRVMALLG